MSSDFSIALKTRVSLLKYLLNYKMLLGRCAYVLGSLCCYVLLAVCDVRVGLTCLAYIPTVANICTYLPIPVAWASQFSSHVLLPAPASQVSLQDLCKTFFNRSLFTSCVAQTVRVFFPFVTICKS